MERDNCYSKISMKGTCTWNCGDFMLRVAVGLRFKEPSFRLQPTVVTEGFSILERVVMCRIYNVSMAC